MKLTALWKTVVWAREGGEEVRGDCEPAANEALASSRKTKSKLVTSSDPSSTHQRLPESFSTKLGNDSFSPLVPGIYLKLANCTGSHRTRAGSPSVYHGRQ